MAEDKLQFRLGVTVDLPDVTLVATPVFNGADLEPYRIPLDADSARNLASHLLGGAAKVDPLGHERVLAQIRDMFGLHVELLSIPPGAMTEH